MNVFTVVKDNVTARQVAMQYGMKISRSGLACCPFHSDKTASMKIDKRYYCFGCGETGDATNRAPPKRVVPQKSKEQILDEEHKRCYRVLSDYYHLLKEWKIKYAPKTFYLLKKYFLTYK